MKSNWIAMQQNPIVQTDRGDLLRKIYDLINWYDENATRKEDDYIKANLKLIIDLAGNVKNSEDIIFIEKMVDTFLDIIKRQRELIRELENEAECLRLSQQSCVTAPADPAEGFTKGEQVRTVFVAHMQRKHKSPFTINDYILRIQNLWRSFYDDFEHGNLPDELAEAVIREEIRQESPLLNAYYYIEELNCYVRMKIAGDSSNRNWLNVRAALNVFGEAMYGEAYVKVKIVRDAAPGKDFSKFLFEGNTYGKSRLVLAVVKKYVEDHHPATFNELELAFPSSLQGSLGVVRRIEDVSDKYKGIGGIKRYFVDDVICLASGEQVIVCTQFGAANTEKFVDHVVKELGCLIEKV